MINRYSLADYQVTIEVDESAPEAIAGTKISIGGPGEVVNSTNGLKGNVGSFVGSVTLKRNKELWETEGDRTGSWVHNQNLDRTGTCEIEIRQVSDMVVKLSQLCAIFEDVSSSIKGLTITVNSTSASGGTVAVCNDCYIQKVPDQAFGETAALQTWTFTCGQVIFYPF